MSHKSIPRHIIGGIAFTNGIVLHTPDAVALAVRESDGTINCSSFPLQSIETSHGFFHLPFIRGLWLLSKTVVMNSRLRHFVQHQTASKSKEQAGKKSSSGSVAPSLFPVLGLIVAFLLYTEVLFIFELVNNLGDGNMVATKSSLVIICLTALLALYVAVKAKLWDYIGYHGAEHQAIAMYEAGKRTHHAISRGWPYQPRCGAAVVSYVAVFLGIVGYYWPYISFTKSVLLSLGFFSVAYELVLFLDHHSDTPWARVMSTPGVLLQLLIARRPSVSQSEVAASALFALSEESKLLKSHKAQKFDLALT